MNNKKLDYFEWISPTLKDIKPKLEEWFDGINSNEMELEERQELLDKIFWYRWNLVDKRMKTMIRDKRTPMEKVSRMVPSIQRIGLSILQSPGVSTKKGRELTDILLDYVRNPEEYYPTIKKTSANLNEIRDYFKNISISKEKREELYSILQG